MVELLNTDGSAQLIYDVKNYLETGNGDVENLISKYNKELTKSMQKLGLNTKPNPNPNSNPIQFHDNTTIPNINITEQNPKRTFRTELKNKPFLPFQIETTKK